MRAKVKDVSQGRGVRCRRVVRELGRDEVRVPPQDVAECSTKVDVWAVPDVGEQVGSLCKGNDDVRAADVGRQFAAYFLRLVEAGKKDAQAVRKRGMLYLGTKVACEGRDDGLRPCGAQAWLRRSRAEFASRAREGGAGVGLWCARR